VSLVGVRGLSGGYACVYLDGALKTSSLAFYSSSTQWQRTLWTVTGIAGRQHRLRIVLRGTEPGPSHGTWVYVSPTLANTTHTLTVQVAGTATDGRSNVGIDYVTIP
jgi:hypothetical protein